MMGLVGSVGVKGQGKGKGKRVQGFRIYRKPHFMHKLRYSELKPTSKKTTNVNSLGKSHETCRNTQFQKKEMRISWQNVFNGNLNFRMQTCTMLHFVHATFFFLLYSEVKCDPLKWDIFNSPNVLLNFVYWSLKQDHINHMGLCNI